MDAEIPFRVGEVLVRKYRLERLIGAGGMGVVFAAVHLELQRQVAVKLLRPDQWEHEASVARFLLEARAIARLNGPHVARVLDVGRLESGAPFMVMELLDGQNLHDLILQQGPPPVPQAVDWLLEACEAVAEAHHAGVLHRDLKPANLFLTRDAYGEPCIKVLDFGISKILDPRDASEVGLTDSQCLVGSPVYMSPEQMRSARDVDQRTDIWGLGTVLFELLSGRPVWSGETFSDLCAQVTRDACPRLSELRPEIPEDLTAVVERCLHKDPFARYQQVSDLSLALARFASQTGRLASKRVLQLTARQSDSAPLAGPWGALSDQDPQATGNVLPATAITRFVAKARPHALLILSLSFAGSLVLGALLVPMMRGVQNSPAQPQAVPISLGTSPADSTRGSRESEPPSTPEPTGAVPGSAVDLAPGANRLEESTQAPATPNQRPRSRAKAAKGDSGGAFSATAPSATRSADPMSIREAAPTSFGDPMSIRK